jgi:hypothetical protein
MRCAAVLLLLGGGLAFAQSPTPPGTLPATRPTSDLQPAQLPTVVPPSAVSKPRAADRAKVVYGGNELEVTANNSSLNQILREIGRATGMKITGGVADERVYGKYGPGPVPEVLASLLEGTGSNMLLTASAAAGPSELILTPQNGGPTPPNPSAPGFDDDLRTEDLSVPPQPGAASPQSQPAAASTPTPPPPGPIRDTPTVAPATDPGTTPAPGPQPSAPDSAASPNGVKTPQQIYQELQQLRQQQPAPTN